MRLSEAIQLGAMMTSQAFRTLFKEDGACALGAALLAVGVAPEQAGRSVRKRWPWAFAVNVNWGTSTTPGRPTAASRDCDVCMLADGVALRNRCPQGQADPRAAIAGGASGVTMARAGPHPRRARHSGQRARGTDG